MIGVNARRGSVAALGSLVAGSLVVGALALGVLRHRGAPALPRLGHVPSFAMTDQRGQPFGDADLRGRVWVADFVFTHCSTACPMLSRKMAALDAATRSVDAARVHLVSFTVDPDRDTRERLGTYAASFGADAARWSFLTGPRAAVEDAIVKGFKVGLTRERPVAGEPPGDGADGFALLHGTRFVLVDAGGFIRGYYDVAEDLDRLAADVERLVAAGGA